MQLTSQPRYATREPTIQTRSSTTFWSVARKKRSNTRESQRWARRTCASNSHTMRACGLALCCVRVQRCAHINVKQKKVRRSFLLQQNATRCRRCRSLCRRCWMLIRLALFGFPCAFVLCTQTCLYVRILCSAPRSTHAFSDANLASLDATAAAAAAAVDPAASCASACSRSSCSPGAIFASCSVSVSLLRQWSVSRGRAFAGAPQQPAAAPAPGQQPQQQASQRRSAPQQQHPQPSTKKQKTQHAPPPPLSASSASSILAS